MDTVKKIYTVQVMWIDKKGRIDTHRNWGWFETWTEADEVIRKNITDIFEKGYYNYALINEVPPGICVGHLKKEYWYEAKYRKKDFDKEGYVKLRANPIVKPCEKPIDKRRIIMLDM